VFRWLADPEGAPGFREQYARAREAQADYLAEQVREIADTPELGETIVTKAGGGTEVHSGDMLGHRRLKIDAYKWLAAKLAPKRYGDKVALVGGGEGDAPVRIEKIERVIVRANAEDPDR
jgi:hypothetical protein